MQYLLRTLQAVDGSMLYDVMEAAAPDAPTLYRSPDRAHAQSVADDLAQGALEAAAVQRIYLEQIAAVWFGPIGGGFLSDLGACRTFASVGDEVRARAMRMNCGKGQ